MSQRLDHGRPLWRFDLVGPLADGREAIVCRIHHAMADGISCVRFLDEVLWDQAPEPAAGSRRAAASAGPPASTRGPGSSRGFPARYAGELGHRATDTVLDRPIGSGARARLRRRPARRAEGDRRLARRTRDRQRRLPRRDRRRPARLARARGDHAAAAAGADPGQPPPPRRDRRRARQPRLVPQRRPAAVRARSARPAGRDQRPDAGAQGPRRRRGALRPVPRAGAVQATSTARSSTSPPARASSASRSRTSPAPPAR